MLLDRHSDRPHSTSEQQRAYSLFVPSFETYHTRRPLLRLLLLCWRFIRVKSVVSFESPR